VTPSAPGGAVPSAPGGTVPSAPGGAVPGPLTVLPVTGIGEIGPGDDLATVIAAHVALADGDVVVVTQKIVSKSEGQMVPVDPDDPDDRRRVVEEQSVRILRRRGDLVISETRHGFVCANAGVDLSNVERGWAALLPEDSDRSARRIRDGLRAATGKEVAVVVSDTFGRPWRKGVVDVAIGCAGLAAVVDLRGTPDANGRDLVATEVCVADEVASAAELVMGKASSVPVAVVRGVDPAWLRRGSVSDEILRPPSEDLFR
jgi:coenzyme F420-0:L-glutamate ligase/coenzyme F420-1:gamma-L-glutamate ligase